MHLLVISREELAEAAESGETIQGLARRLDVFPENIRKLSIEYGIPLLTDAQKRNMERLVFFTELAERGYTRGEIAREAGVSMATVWSVMRFSGVLIRRKPHPRPNAERDTEMVDGRLSGMTLQKIGDKHGLTRERVRQILKRRGVPLIKGVRKKHKSKYDSDTIRELALQGLTVEEICRQVGCSEEPVRRVCRSTGQFNPKTLNLPNNARLLAEYEAGLSIRQLSKKYGVCWHAISARVSSATVERAAASQHAQD